MIIQTIYHENEEGAIVYLREYKRKRRREQETRRSRQEEEERKRRERRKKEGTRVEQGRRQRLKEKIEEWKEVLGR